MSTFDNEMLPGLAPETPPPVAEEALTLVDVAVAVPLHRTFHYRVPTELARELKPGSILEVSFRKRAVPGFVLGFPETAEIALEKILRVDKVLFKEPVLDEEMLKFLRWVAEYYCHPIGEVLATAVPRASVQRAKKPRAGKAGAGDMLTRLEALSQPTPKPTLTAEQTAAVAAILDSSDTRPILLHGVTGSGKTEVYMSSIEAAVAEGRGAIVLVPEIALTPQLLGRFSGRFPGQVAVLHSDLTVKERAAQWDRLRDGRARIVVGARSAVFAPIARLGLIVVDEEHEGSFKQEDTFRYHARDVAVVRARLCGAKTVLGSATPSLESYANALAEKYRLVELKKRVNDRPLPKTLFVDIRHRESWHSPQHPWLSRILASRISQTLAEKQQTMLFLNRLGFAHFLYCRDCGHTWRCLNCDVALTFYRSPPLLKCHYCGLAKEPPDTCEQCHGTHLDTMGLGTEQVERALKALFPTARIARMDRSVVKTRQELEALLLSIQAREIDIIVGTQMIAKGHDFPAVALVGVLVADASLNLPDFRAHERTFQIITQVSGRAGRAETPGEVVVQTLNPEHPVLVAAAENRSADFYRTELESRKAFGFPPYQRLAMLRFQHRNAAQVEQFAKETVEGLRGAIGRFGWRCTVLGPAEAPLARLKNLYRWQCLLKSDSVRDLQAALRGVHGYVTERKSPVQTAVDVDPVNSL